MSEFNDKLADTLSNVIQKDSHPLDLFVKRVVNNVLSTYVIPWLVECLEKYSEEDFHQKMSDQTWDFITDWQTNHAKRFKAFIWGARRLRYAYDFDSRAITKAVVAQVLEKHGWTVSETETIQIYYTLEKLREMIEQ